MEEKDGRLMVEGRVECRSGGEGSMVEGREGWRGRRSFRDVITDSRHVVTP